MDWLHLARNRHLKHVIARSIEGRMKVRERRGTRRKQALDNNKETRGNWKLIALSVENSFWKSLAYNFVTKNLIIIVIIIITIISA
jgi:hypothetical protein